MVLALSRQQYMGYGAVSLIVEVNSIFLHIRQLLQLLGYAKDDYIYRLNSVLNLSRD